MAPLTPLAIFGRSLETAIDKTPTLSSPSDLKITDIKCGYIKGCLFVKIYTNQDVWGCGRCHPRHVSPGEKFWQQVKGKSPLNVHRLFEDIRKSGFFQGAQSGMYVAVLSAIETALWDLTGKALALPVYQLLGGKQQRIKSQLKKRQNKITKYEVQVLNEMDTGIKIFMNDKIRMSSVYEYIDARFDQSPDVNYIAAQVHLSTAAFFWYFKKQKKMTFTEFVNQYRVNQAKTLLLQDKNISETAYAIGFDSISYFNKLFKKSTGENPSDLKNDTCRGDSVLHYQVLTDFVPGKIYNRYAVWDDTIVVFLPTFNGYAILCLLLLLFVA